MKGPVSNPGAPKTGPRRYDTSRELAFDRPARVGATPFWDRPTPGPQSSNIRRLDSPFGGMRNKNNNHDGSKVLPMC
jgi:hypothetical protein